MSVLSSRGFVWFSKQVYQFAAIWNRNQSQERKAARPDCARSADLRAARHHGLLDRPLSQAVGRRQRFEATGCRAFAR